MLINYHIKELNPLFYFLNHIVNHREICSGKADLHNQHINQ